MDVEDDDDDENDSGFLHDNDDVRPAVIKKAWDQVYRSESNDHLLFGSPKTDVDLSALQPEPGPNLQALADLPGQRQPAAQSHPHPHPAGTHHRRRRRYGNHQSHIGSADVQYLLRLRSKSHQRRMPYRVGVAKRRSSEKLSVRMSASATKLWGSTVRGPRLLDSIVSLPGEPVRLPSGI